MLYSGYALTQADQQEKARHKSSFGHVSKYLPHTSGELRSFVGVSVTAGVVEEIVYRGFVFWYLGQWMPLWAVVIVSSAAFGLGHSYQGWLPIIAHVLLDALQGAAILEILRDDDGRVTPDAA